MKYALAFFAAAMLLCTAANAQTKQWLDENFKIQAAEKGAKYYQIVNKDGAYKVYQTNGTIYQEGKYTSLDNQYANGTLTFYDEKGNFVKTGEYVNGLEKPIPFYSGDSKEPYKYVGITYQYEEVAAGANGCDNATQAGLNKLADKVRALGANAVVNMHIEITTLQDKTMRVTLYGTAVKM